MGSQPTCLYFMVQLENVVCYTEKSPFNSYIALSAQHKSSEFHVFLNHSKYTLCLDRETSVYACKSRGLAEKLRTEYGF